MHTVERVTHQEKHGKHQEKSDLAIKKELKTCAWYQQIFFHKHEEKTEDKCTIRYQEYSDGGIVVLTVRIRILRILEEIPIRTAVGKRLRLKLHFEAWQNMFDAWQICHDVLTNQILMPMPKVDGGNLPPPTIH